MRMGQPKMLMPWGRTTVIGKVIETVQAAGVDEITLVVNSSLAKEIELPSMQIVVNDDGEMLSSVQAGLKAQKSSAQATLICLGDQPQVEEGSVRSVCVAYQEGKSQLVVPSYQMRRGHPWLIARELWDEILYMREAETMRDFLSKHADEILYVECDTASVLQDLDTPEDYRKFKPA